MLNDRKWIVTFSVFILLLIAWPLRFEHITTMTSGGVRGVFFRDRWTGQRWVSLFGSAKGQNYTGEMVPLPSQRSITAKKNQILAEPDMAQKVQGLSSQIAQNLKTRDQHIEIHKEWVNLVSKREKFFWPVLPKPGAVDAFQEDIDTINSAMLKYDNQLRADIVKGNTKWVNANKAAYNANLKLKSLQNGAQTQAVNILRNKAWRVRNFVAGGWAFLLIASFVLSAFFFLRQGKPVPPQQVRAAEQKTSAT